MIHSECPRCAHNVNRHDFFGCKDCKCANAAAMYFRDEVTAK